MGLLGLDWLAVRKPLFAESPWLYETSPRFAVSRLLDNHYCGNLNSPQHVGKCSFLSANCGPLQRGYLYRSTLAVHGLEAYLCSFYCYAEVEEVFRLFTKGKVTKKIYSSKAPFWETCALLEYLNVLLLTPTRLVLLTFLKYKIWVLRPPLWIITGCTWVIHMLS